jgi:regulator of protease activity HflC (stomatin/prohibitin superfamily)
MSRPILILVIVLVIVIWGRLFAVLSGGKTKRAAGIRVMPLERPQAPSGRVLPSQLSSVSSNLISRPPQETHMNPISALIFIIFVGGAVLSFITRMPLVVTIVLALVGIFLGYSVKMAQQWEKAVILRLGKLFAVKGPGLFILVPIIDQVTMWIDQRIRTSEFSAEQALTRDTVPVNVDAIVFWMVHDAERAALEIVDYNSAIQRVAQTSLREMIGSSVLSELLSERKEADATLKEVIGAKTAEWGVTVNSVEIRDVAIPANLQDAMSRQAQAERERQARVILGQAEEDVAQKFLNAARIYAENPEALQLRAMNIIYETTKERGATILMPTSMVDAMNPGAAAFALNMAKIDAGQNPGRPPSSGPSVPPAGKTNS